MWLQAEFCFQNARNELDTNLHNEQRIYSQCYCKNLSTHIIT